MLPSLDSKDSMLAFKFFTLMKSKISTQVLYAIATNATTFVNDLTTTQLNNIIADDDTQLALLNAELEELVIHALELHACHVRRFSKLISSNTNTQRFVPFSNGSTSQLTVKNKDSYSLIHAISNQD